MQPLNDIGDPAAPPGSMPWCKARKFELLQKLRDSKSTVLRLKFDLQSMRDNNYYFGLNNKDGSPIETWEAFCRSEPPWGLGIDPEFADALMDEEDTDELIVTSLEKYHVIKAARKHGGLTKEEMTAAKERVKNGGDIIPSISSRGTSAAHMTARLKRDNPELADKVFKGELSANAAAIQAGFRHKQIQIPADDIDRAARLLKRNFGDRIGELIRALSDA